MFCEAQRPPRQSLPPRDGPSTVSWVAVIACTVVMRPSTMPNLSFTTFASGARQLVVHEALLTTSMSDLYSVWFTPQTNIGTSSFGGAEMITFLQPPPRWRPAIALLHRPRVLLVHRVVLQHVDHVLQVHERIVDRNNLNLRVGHSRAEHEAADAAETVDAHLRRHDCAGRVSSEHNLSLE